MTLEQMGKEVPKPPEKGRDKMKKGGSAIERVSSASPTMQLAAMRLAIQRTPGTVTNQDALEQYVQASFRAEKKEMPARGAGVAGLNGVELTELWKDGERIISRASELVGERLARAWAYELSKQRRGMAVDPLVAPLIFRALAKEEKANEEITRVLSGAGTTARTARVGHVGPIDIHALPRIRLIGTLHRQRIVQGVARFVEFLQFGRHTIEDDAATTQLIEDWRANPAAAATLADTHPPDPQPDELRNAELLDFGQERFGKLVSTYPEIATGLALAEKGRYVRHLGSWIGTTKVRRLWNPQIGEIENKIRAIKARSQRAGTRQGYLERKAMQSDARHSASDEARGESLIDPRALAILNRAWTGDEGKKKLATYKRLRGKVGGRRGGLLGMTAEERAVDKEARRIVKSMTRVARAQRGTAAEAQSASVSGPEVSAEPGVNRFETMDIIALEELALSNELKRLSSQEIRQLRGAIDKKTRERDNQS